jgi:hypothetical protein
MSSRSPRPPSTFTSLLLAILVGGAAHAGPPAPTAEAKAKAKEHYEGAMRFYRNGQFGRACEEYLASYEAVHDPALLFNAAQAYRLDRDWVHALKYYRDFLAVAIDAAGKASAEAHIKSVEASMAAQAKAAKKGAPPPPEGASNRAPEIAAAIKTHRDGFRACFDAWSKSHIGVDASFVLVMWIDGDGSIEDSAAAGIGVDAPDAEECIAKQARSLKMPTSKEGYRTRFAYPFNFKAH